MSATPQRGLLACVPNAGRSRMAEAFTNRFARWKGLPVEGFSAGAGAGSRVNPLAGEVLEKFGLSMEGRAPKPLAHEPADSASRIITAGGGAGARLGPARIHPSEDRGLDDRAEQPIEKVRPIRDQVRERVEAILAPLVEEPSR